MSDHAPKKMAYLGIKNSPLTNSTIETTSKRICSGSISLRGGHSDNSRAHISSLVQSQSSWRVNNDTFQKKRTKEFSTLMRAALATKRESFMEGTDFEEVRKKPFSLKKKKNKSLDTIDYKACFTYRPDLGLEKKIALQRSRLGREAQPTDLAVGDFHRKSLQSYTTHINSKFSFLVKKQKMPLFKPPDNILDWKSSAFFFCEYLNRVKDERITMFKSSLRNQSKVKKIKELESTLKRDINRSKQITGMAHLDIILTEMRRNRIDIKTATPQWKRILKNHDSLQ